MGLLDKIRQVLASAESPSPGPDADSVLGKMGTVSATVPAVGLGEVRISGVRGTVEAYSARSADGVEIAEGVTVVVVEHPSPQQVIVTPLGGTLPAG